MVRSPSDCDSVESSCAGSDWQYGVSARFNAGDTPEQEPTAVRTATENALDAT